MGCLQQVVPQHVDELWIMGLVSALFRLASDHSNAKNGAGPIIRQDPNAPRLAERCAQPPAALSLDCRPTKQKHLSIQHRAEAGCRAHVLAWVPTRVHAEGSSCLVAGPRGRRHGSRTMRPSPGWCSTACGWAPRTCWETPTARCVRVVHHYHMLCRRLGGCDLKWYVNCSALRIQWMQSSLACSRLIRINPCVCAPQNYFLRAMVCMITGQPSRLTDPAVLMEMLAIVRSWLLSPPPSGGAPHPEAPELRTHAPKRWGPSSSTGCEQAPRSPAVDQRCVLPAGLSEKESALFMERLAALERSGATEGPIKGAWEDAFLDLTHRLITQPGTEVRRACSLPLTNGCTMTANAEVWLCMLWLCSVVHVQ